jgi:hypothetical protein
MMNCCEKDNAKTAKQCPFCHQKGTNVKSRTLLALLKEAPRLAVMPKTDYFYCKQSTCSVVYYADDHYFLISDLMVKAFDKDPGLAVPVCYCFHYTRESLLNDLQRNQEPAALTEIKFKMKDPGCFCEQSNPQGSCCLGNVTAYVNEHK